VASFASDLLGLQIASRSDDRLLLRLDDKSYRLDICRGEVDAVTVLGWEVKGPNELSELAERLERNGYASSEPTPRRYENAGSGLIEFEDPDGSRRELFYGAKRDSARFVSPTAARSSPAPAGSATHSKWSPTPKPSGSYTSTSSAQAHRLHRVGGGYGRSCTPTRDTTPSRSPRRRHPGPAGSPDVRGGRHRPGRPGLRQGARGAAPLALSFGKHTNDEMLSFYVTSPSGFSVEYGFGGRLIDDSVWAPDRYDTPSYWVKAPGGVR